MIKNLILTLAIAASVVGCGDGFNQTKLRQVIVEDMKTTDIVPTPDHQYKFIVRTPDGAVWLVECMSSKAEITSKALLFPATSNR